MNSENDINMGKERNFFDIPLNLDMKQTDLDVNFKTRSSKFKWRGQFSPQFAELLIKTYSNEGDIVFDPFSGSGTIIGEAIAQKRSAIGIELNPAAFYMSDFYRILTLELPNRERLITIVEIIFSESPHDAIQKMFNDNNENVQSIAGLLVILADIEGKEIDPDMFLNVWQEIKFDLLTANYENSVITYLGDARNRFLKSGSADITITSPPYINVLNYHQQYRKSMEYLSWNILGIAKNEVGSNRKNRGNRFYSVEDYIKDMTDIIRNTIHATKQGGRIIYVVGRESTVLGEKFYNGEIIYKIFMLLNQKMLARQERTFKNRFGVLITEDILHFESSNMMVDSQDIREGLSKIIVETLSAHLETVSIDRKILLEKAINRARELKNI